MFRKMHKNEKNEVYKMGFLEWGRDKSSYWKENKKEENFGIRCVYTINDEVISSLIVFPLSFSNDLVYGIGSVVTKRKYRKRGYAKKMLIECINYFKSLSKEKPIFILHSEIDPLFYEKLGFKCLPPHLQQYQDTVTMVYCTDEQWNDILISKPIFPYP